MSEPVATFMLGLMTGWMTAVIVAGLIIILKEPKKAPESKKVGT